MSKSTPVSDVTSRRTDKEAARGMRSMESQSTTSPREIDHLYDNYRRKRQRTMTVPSSKTSSMEMIGVSESEEKCTNAVASATASHGSISVIGRRRVMDDAVKIIPGFMGVYDFFAIYDGQGEATVANVCRERMHLLVAEEVAEEGGEAREVDWNKVMSSCFMRMDREIGGGDGSRCREESMVGSTAMVVVVGREGLVVANCGDSRAVLCRAGLAVPLSRDYKSDCAHEKERVETTGRRVINWNGNRFLGVLATSTSIGERSMKAYVITEPEVSVYERREEDEFMIVASDGLWDVISNSLACEVVRRCLDGEMRRIFNEGFVRSCAAEAAALLAELAMARGSKDNITVIVAQLKPFTSSSSDPPQPLTSCSLPY